MRHILPVNFKKEKEKVCGMAKKGKQRQPQVGHQIDFGNHVAKALPSSYWDKFKDARNRGNGHEVMVAESVSPRRCRHKGRQAVVV